MRVLALMICALLAAVPSSPPQIRAIKGFEPFQQWASAVRDHVPGEWDGPARAISAWPADELQRLTVDLVQLRKLLAAGGKLPFVTYPYPELPRVGARPTNRVRQILWANIPAMLLISNEQLGVPTSTSGAAGQLALSRLEGQITRLVKLAAMLHADIAMLAPPRPATGGSSGLNTGILRIADGQTVGRDDAPMQWGLGCTALDLVTPDPAADPFVVAWYRATAAWQGSQRHYGYEAPHLTYGLKVLPADAWLHFYAGVMHENLAAPPVQTAVASLPAEVYASSGLNVSQQLESAERSLQRALDLDPGLALARLRLTRVMALRGRHADAAAALENLMPALTDRSSRYYAELFLGAEAQVLGRLDDARAALVRARALFPNAQSPHLALGQLAWARADRASATAALRAMAAFPAGAPERWDPWWTYDVFPVADAPDRVDALRAGARGEREKEKGQRQKEEGQKEEEKEHDR